MTWNLRVVKEVHQSENLPPETTYTVYEVFYNPDGSILGWGTAEVHGETLEELQEYNLWVQEALAKPVIDGETKKEIHEDRTDP